MDRREVESRRANNQIWNGAGDYGLRPQFQVYGKDGRAALYFNTVIGLLYRTYDYKKLSALFYSFREQVNGELYTTQTCFGWGWSGACISSTGKSAPFWRSSGGTMPARW